MKAIRTVSAYLTISAVALGLAGCVPQAAPPPPAPRPVPRPAPPPPAPRPAPADWRDAAQTPGTWRWSMEGGRSVARYGLTGETVASLACTPGSGATILWRTGAANGAASLTVTTTGTRRMLSASAQPGGGVAVSLPARDPLLDAMAFSRGRFMLEMPGTAPLYLPAWPEISRVIEDCR